MDESIAHGTAFPAPLEHGGVSIQALVADPAVFRLDAQEQGFPFTRAFPDTHGQEYSQRIEGITNAGVFPAGFRPRPTRFQEGAFAFSFCMCSGAVSWRDPMSFVFICHPCMCSVIH